MTILVINRLLNLLSRQKVNLRATLVVNRILNLLSQQKVNLMGESSTAGKSPTIEQARAILKDLASYRAEQNGGKPLASTLGATGKSGSATREFLSNKAMYDKMEPDVLAAIINNYYKNR